MGIRKGLIIFLAIVTAWVLVACGAGTPPPTPTPPPLAEELVFYDWSEDSIANVFDTFTEEYGVKIVYKIFDSTEEAVENMRVGICSDYSWHWVY